MSFIKNATAAVAQAPTDDKPFRWSFSQWENYDGCPARWRFKSVLKLPTLPPGPAAARGLALHSRVEDYIMGQCDQEHMLMGNPAARYGDKPEAKVDRKFIPIIDAFKDHPNGDRGVEKKLGFDLDWIGGGYRTGTGGCTMVWDAYRVEKDEEGATVVHIGEWKSGKPKDTHKDQRHLYGLGALLNNLGAADKAIVTTHYLEGGYDSNRLTVTSADIPKMKAKWDSRIDMMRSDKICAPKPGFGCNWCDFAKKKGGPCQFGS